MNSSSDSPSQLNLLIVVNSDSFAIFNSLFTAVQYFYENPLIGTVALLDLQHNQTFFSNLDDMNPTLHVIAADESYAYSNFHDYKTREAQASDFDGVLMRMTAPMGYDLDAFYTKMKKLFPVPFINDLDGMLEFGSKGKLAELQSSLIDDGVSYIPEVRNCSSAKEIHDFRQAVDADIVIKSFYGYGGNEVFLMSYDGFCEFDDDAALDEFIQKVGGQVCVQKFVQTDRVIDDRLILLFDPKTQSMQLTCIMRRTAPQGEWRANASQGATLSFYHVDERHKKIAKILGPQLVEAGIYLAGIDVLYDQEQLDSEGQPLPKITEINVRNVGGLINTSEWAGIDYTRQFTDGICWLLNEHN